MKLGIRGRLFLISLSLILVMALVSGAYLQFRLRDWLEDRVATELEVQARRISSLLGSLGETEGELTQEKYELIARSLGSSESWRVTIINEDGTVLGDTEVPEGDLGEVERHLDRPEVQDALNNGYGVSRRYSTTLRIWMLYVAVPYEAGTRKGVVRMAMHLSEIDVILKRLAGIIGFGVLVGVVVAALMSILASHLMSGTLRNLIKYSRQLAEGKKISWVEVDSRDEIGGLAGSINTLSEELEGMVNDLARERNHLESVLEAMEDGVLAIDENMVVTLANGVAVELLGIEYSPVGRTFLEIIQVPALYDAASMKGIDEPTAVEFDLPGARPVRLLAYVTEQKGGGGKVIVMRDVTEIRELENARRDFFANASHELRTPVGIIQANAETLIGGAMNDPEKAAGFLEAIYRNSIRLSGLISDLLQISRIEEGRYKLDIGPVTIGEPVEKAMEAIRKPAQDKGITLSNEISGQLAGQADAKALEDIFYNLLDNAVKYCDEGGKVVLRGKEYDGKVVIEVEDDGPGIPPEAKKRIFERFYRVDTGRSREKGGTGLGLSIVKHLVTTMGGEVRVENVRPHGSIFVVSLGKGSS